MIHFIQATINSTKSSTPTANKIIQSTKCKKSQMGNSEQISNKIIQSTKCKQTKTNGNSTAIPQHTNIKTQLTLLTKRTPPRSILCPTRLRRQHPTQLAIDNDHGSKSQVLTASCRMQSQATHDHNTHVRSRSHTQDHTFERCTHTAPHGIAWDCTGSGVLLSGETHRWCVSDDRHPSRPSEKVTTGKHNRKTPSKRTNVFCAWKDHAGREKPWNCETAAHAPPTKGGTNANMSGQSTCAERLQALMPKQQPQ